MNSFFKIKSVGSGMERLLDTFCQENNLKSPVNHIYEVDERIPYGRWLKKIRFVEQQYKKEGLGIEIAKNVNYGHIGISAYIAKSCQNLSEFLHLGVKYNKIWYDYIDKKIENIDNNIIISWDKPTYYYAGLYKKETDILDELQVAIYYQRIHQLIGTSYKIFNHVDLAIPIPRNQKKYRDYFKCPVYFNTIKTSFSINKEILYIPILDSDQTLLQLLIKQAELILNEIPSGSNFMDLVNKSIIDALDHSEPKMEIIANSLSMSTRKLQNTLKNKGVKFQDLLNNARYILAQQYLLDSKLSILEISSRLGYKEQASFNRAFRIWTNQSPLQWREKNLKYLHSEITKSNKL